MSKLSITCRPYLIGNGTQAMRCRTSCLTVHLLVLNKSQLAMGWFGNSTVDPPNKSSRKVCWESRDKFFECLTAHGIDNSLDPNQKDNVNSHCGTLRTEFQNNCVASWFKYFQEKRYNDLTRERYIKKLESEGAQELPFKLAPPKK